jgi:putative glutamine amidotransferase
MRIAIPGWMVGPNSFGVTIPYIEFMREMLVADEIMILTPDAPEYTDLDLLILPGGADVNPNRYGEVPSFYTDKPDPIKEYFDTFILPRYINNGTPIFGICRGCQTLAVHFGGRLIQDMYHDTNPSDEPYKGVHHLRVLDKPAAKVKVNSRHHQSINPRSLEGLNVNVLATHANIPHHVEAIRIQGHKIAAVQFHPEDLNDSTGVQYALSLIKSIER